MESLGSTGIELIKQVTHKMLIVVNRLKVAAASQHQGLIQGPFESMVTLLDVPVFVRAPGLDLTAFKTVVTL